MGPGMTGVIGKGRGVVKGGGGSCVVKMGSRVVMMGEDVIVTGDGVVRLVSSRAPRRLPAFWKVAAKATLPPKGTRAPSEAMRNGNRKTCMLLVYGKLWADLFGNLKSSKEECRKSAQNTFSNASYRQ